MAQSIGSPIDAPPQITMQPVVDMSWVQPLDNVVFCRSKMKVLSESGGSIRAECPLLNNAGHTVLTLNFESTDRHMRQFVAQLKSADGKTAHAQFDRPAMEVTGTNMVFGSLANNTKPCQISVVGSHYATTSGSEVMNNLSMQKVGSAGGVKIGKAVGCKGCCCTYKDNFDDFAGQTVAVVTVGNGSCCPCNPNTGQRRVLPLPSNQSSKLDALLFNVCFLVGIETVARSG